MECDNPDNLGADVIAHFNSRTHVECDDGFDPEKSKNRKISTHALTWSATDSSRLTVGRCAFQLTHSRGVRPMKEELESDEMQISTHALTWSATLILLNPPFTCSTFQLTHSRGVRHNR